MKKLSAITVYLLLTSAILFAGGQKEEQTNITDETMTVQDLTGRTVQVPAKIERIATPNVDAYRILVQLGAEDKLVGIPSNMYGSQFSEKDSIEIRVWQEAKNLTKVGGGPPNSEINLEAFLQVKPDIIITWGRKNDSGAAAKADDLQTKTGIPVIALSIYSMGDKLPAVDEAYSLLGKLSGREERAEELLAYFHGEIEKIADVTRSVPQEERPKIFFGSIRNLQAGGFYPSIEYLQLNSLTDKSLFNKEIPKEQMLAWNPDVIFLHTASQSYRPSVDFYYNDEVLKDLNAVKNKRVYRYKGFFMGWDIATGLVDTFYIAKLTYPELFTDRDIKEKANEILETFYGIPDLLPVLIEQSDLSIE